MVGRVCPKLCHFRHFAPAVVRGGPASRWPGVRIASTNSSWAFRQVGFVNSVAKGASMDTMASGRVSMAGPFLFKVGSGQLILCLYFF